MPLTMGAQDPYGRAAEAGPASDVGLTWRATS